MQNALDQERGPIEGRLQAVIPGINERFDASHKATIDLERKIGELSEKMDSQYALISSLAQGRMGNQQGSNSDKDELVQRLRAALHIMAGGGIENVGGLLPQEELLALPAPPVVAAAPIVCRPPLLQGQNRQEYNERPVIELLAKYRDLRDFNQHWFGEGDYWRADGWSIAKLEEKFTSKWRNKWSRSKTCSFTRAAQIIKAIKKEANNQNRSIDDVVEDWNERVKEAKGKFTVCGMVDWIDNTLGLREKQKKRGKNAAK